MPKIDAFETRSDCTDEVAAMGKPKDSPLDNERHWERYCDNKDGKKKVISGQTLQSTAKPKSAPVEPTNVEDNQSHSILALVECFSDVKDPRVNRRRRHNLIDLIVIAICAVICNADGWADIRTWAETHEHWLTQFLELPGGLPSRDTLRRTISRIDPEAFQKAFIKWLKGRVQRTWRCDRDRWQDASWLEGRWQEAVTHCQCLGERSTSDAWANRSGREIERNHGNSEAFGYPESFRSHCHDRRNGLPESDRFEDHRA